MKKALRHIILFLSCMGIVCIAFSCSSAAQGECQYDTDCPGLKVCVDKRCVPMGHDAGPDGAVQDAGNDSGPEDGDEVSLQDDGAPGGDVADSGGDESPNGGEDGADGNGGDAGVFSCPESYVIPPGTVIIPKDGQDDLSPRNFDQAFDAPGNRIDSTSAAGQIKAWEFTNDAFKYGNISGTGGNYGGNYKDWSISACPGDFSSTLPAKCRRFKQLGVTMTYHATDAALGCVVPPGQTMYLNIRASDPSLAAGYAVSNAVI